ncbi:thioredoxin reductase [Rhizobium subbaraonis]|uniref:Thioredoxin reductase n=1 Tax=Rhizobium subbaraonis TaxID=908946 RepID=A0A285UGV4_9HYPH|nr:NAD(P)/FAD-dependent oxidoreductase [Rhizobium subbaraonis]SOC39491.1 thioredoxin reductase [Rhizobium subbaraonis]
MTEDAVIIGGGFAGLSAAMQLARARRRVTILDTGAPRNRFASHSHGVLAMDGRPGADILATARAQLATYDTVTFRPVEATKLDGDIDAFRVATSDGEEIAGRRVLLATGFEDVLPTIPGLSERWGRTVLHCPYCHGYEIDRGPLGLLARTADAIRLAAIIADWGDVTLFTNEAIEPDAAAIALLEQRGVNIRSGRVLAVDGREGEPLSVQFDGGSAAVVKALFVMPESRVRSAIPHERDLAFRESPIGQIIATDEGRQTSLPGLYAAGDIALGPANITFASADGVKAGVMLHHSLILPAH